MIPQKPRIAGAKLSKDRAIYLVGTAILLLMFLENPCTIASSDAEKWASDFHASVTDGIVWQGDKGYPRIHLGGLFAPDYVNYDPRNTHDSGLRFDRASILLDGFLNPDWEFWIAGDLIGTDTEYGFEEAWISYTRARWLRATGGLIQIPLGPEFAIPEAYLAPAGYSFPPYIDGRTAFAIALDGEFRDGFFYYDFVAASGEGFDLLGEKVGGSQFSARLVSYPFRANKTSFSLFGYEIPVLSGLFGSFAFAYSPSFDRELDVANPLENKLFDVPRLETDSSRLFHFGLGADAGPFRIYGELVQMSLFDLETEQGEVDLEDQIKAWEATFSWMVTGEHYDSRPFMQRELREKMGEYLPGKPLWGMVGKRGFGALEVAVRYSNADIDRRFFGLGLADFATSSQEFRTFTAAVNWYPIINLRVTAEVVRTLADQFPAVFDSHGRDTSFLFRLQYAF